ncbi:MAG: T9SS type A sorting domain-containing protein [Saprospiraceae bacterium]|nr:T9SS type A sorting domain-containing protein [Saprospiraceae bacterium]MCB9323414.1 T9SS type A sorting domain-containing protein [Lewinellaceae bacterium]
MNKFLLLLVAVLGIAFGQNAFGQCNYSLEMNDVFGDGWNGNTMDVLVNGIVVLDDVTIINGYQAILIFPVTYGDDITTLWNGGGQYGYETSYRILDNDGNEAAAATGTNITSGTITANCPTCPAPSELTATNITNTGATLGWTEGESAMSWDLEIVLSGNPPSGIPTQNDINTNPFLWTGATSPTSYDFYVRADCEADGGIGQSGWVGPFTFTTLPGCGDSWYDTGGAGADYFDNESIQTTVCPDVGGEVISADFASFMTESGFDGMVIYNGNSIMDPIISSGLPAGEDPTTCPEGSFYGATSPGIVTSTAANGCLTFLFRSDGATTDSGWEVTFACLPNPDCLPPSPLTATNINGSGADLGWTENGSAGLWDLEIVPAGFLPTGVPSFNNVNTNPFHWTGADSNTSYDFYVRSDCEADGGTGQSSWAGPFTFTTLPGCGDNWYDTGGSTGEYSNDESIQTTVCPTMGGDVITTVFTSFNTEYGFDGMVVYNGAAITDPIIASGLGVGIDTINCPAGSYYGTTSPATVTSTAPNGCLTFWFRSDGATTSTGWEATFSCTLPPECAAPSTLIATTITSLGANLGWTENGTATHWDIEIGASGFSPTGIPTYEDVDTNPFQWSEGAFETSYDFYVRTDCEASGGVGQSNWVGPFTFTTLCGVYVPDYAQDFSTFLPNCWEVGKGPLSGPTTTGVSGWKADGFANNGETGAIKFNIWKNDDEDWLISPTFDLTAGGFILNVDVAVTGNGNTLPSDMGSDDQVLLMQSTDGGGNWTTIHSWDVNNTPSNVGDNIFVDISALTSATAVFAFYVNEGSVEDLENYDFFVDNFKIQPPPPENNDLCNATPLILGTPCSGDIYSNIYATVETYEPVGNCSAGITNSVWFSFAAPPSGRVTITTDIAPGDIGDTEITVYGEGVGFECSDLNTLNSQLGCDQDNGTVVSPGTMSVLSLNCLTQGAFYYIQVDGGNDSIGHFCIEVADEGYFPVVPASSLSITSDSSCIDGAWTHFFHSSNNEILLSLKIGSTGAIIPNDGVTIDPDGASDAFWVPSVPGNLVDNGMGAAFMKRKWSVSPTTDPIGAVGVRFYYTTEEYEAINAEIVNQAGTPLSGHTDLRFFTINNGSDPFSVGSLSNADGIELYHGAPSTTSWTHGMYNGQHYAEFLVDGFFGGGGGGGAPGGVALPVELLSFSGKEMEKYNLLEWITASEVNTKVHVLERSTDEINFFETIGQLNGAGNSNHPVSYQLRDNAPLFKGFYRLKTIDFDGREHYSNIINIERKDGEEGILNIFPNPVKDQLTIQILASATGPGNFSLTDVAGRKLMEAKIVVEKGLNVHTFDLSNLPAGIYYLSYKNGKVQTFKRVVKG